MECLVGIESKYLSFGYIDYLEMDAFEFKTYIHDYCNARKHARRDA